MSRDSPRPSAQSSTQAGDVPPTHGKAPLFLDCLLDCDSLAPASPSEHEVMKSSAPACGSAVAHPYVAEGLQPEAPGSHGQAAFPQIAPQPQIIAACPRDPRVRSSDVLHGGGRRGGTGRRQDLPCDVMASVAEEAEGLPTEIRALLQVLGTSLLHISRRPDGALEAGILPEQYVRPAYEALAAELVESHLGTNDPGPEHIPAAGEAPRSARAEHLLKKIATALSNYTGYRAGVALRPPPPAMMSHAILVLCGNEVVTKEVSSDRSFTVGRAGFGNDIVMGGVAEDAQAISRCQFFGLPDLAAQRWILVDLGCRQGFSIRARGLSASQDLLVTLDDLASLPGQRRPLLAQWTDTTVVDFHNGYSMIFNPRPCQVCRQQPPKQLLACGHAVVCLSCEARARDVVCYICGFRPTIHPATAPRNYVTPTQ